jgi:hypothetical protein
VPDPVAENVGELFAMLVPLPDVCQYQVTPEGGVPLTDKVLGPHAFEDAESAGGLKIELIVTV